MANGVNRFFNPTVSQYQSQFIPEKLPTELLLTGLANKEKQYNDNLNKINLLGDWSQNALPGYDTQTVNEYKKKIREKIDSWYNQDLTSGDFQREYMDFNRSLKDNQDLAQISQNYAHDKEAQDLIQKYKTGNTNDYESAFVEDYIRRRNIYTADTGKGYKGEIQLGDKNILKGGDIQKAKEELFDHLKASGSENLADLGGIYYKNGWKGINQKQIESATAKQIDDFYNQREGQQIAARFDVMNAPEGMPISVWKEQMSPKEREEYEDARKTYVAKDVLRTGETFKYSDTTTNKDAALNKSRDEMLAQGPGEQPFLEPGYTVGKANKDIKTDTDKAYHAVANNEHIQKDINVLNQVLSGIKGKTDLTQLFRSNPNLVAELKGIDGITQAQLTGVIAKDPNAIKEVENLIAVKNKQIENNNLEIDVFRSNMKNTLNEMHGQSYNGKNYSQITDIKNHINKVKGDGYAEQLMNWAKQYAATPQKFESAINNIRANVPEFKNLSTEDIKAMIKAENDFSVALDNPASTQMFYQGAGQSNQPNAVAVNPNKDYISRIPKFDANNNFIGFEVNGKAKTVDQELQNSIQTNPSIYTIKDLNGNVIKVNPTKVTLGSVNRTRPGDEKLNINAKIIVNQKVKVETFDEDGNSKGFHYVDKPVEKEVVIESSGSNYDEKRAKEFESGILSGNINARSPYPEGVGSSKKVGKYTVYTLNDNASEIQKANYREYNAIVNKGLNKQLQEAKDVTPGGSKVVTDNFGGANVTFKVHKIDDNNTGGRYTAEIFGNEINADSYDELESQIYNIKNQYLIRR